MNTEKENFARFNLLLAEANKVICSGLQNYFSINDPIQFCNELQKYKQRLQSLRRKGILKKNQIDALYPVHNQTFVKDIDITLAIILFRSCVKMNPTGGWNRVPVTNNTTFFDDLVRIRNFQNICAHNSMIELDKKEFENMTDETQIDSLTSVLLRIASDKIAMKDSINICLNGLITHKEEEMSKEIHEQQKQIALLENTFDGIWYEVPNELHDFVGREKILGKIHRYVETDNKPIVLHGCGGIGKTQISIKYAHLYGAKYFSNNIIWIHSNGVEELNSEFFKLARYANLPTSDENGKPDDICVIVKRVYRAFSKHQFLFVFDNVNNFEEIISFLPNAPSNGDVRVLLTSRNARWGNNFNSIEVELFSKETAENFAKILVPRELQKSKESENAIEELCKEIDYFPLALHQALSYIVNNFMPIMEYLVLFRSKKEYLLNYNVDGVHYSETLFSIWSIVLEKLRSTEENHYITTLIHLMSFMDNIHITQSFLKECGFDILQLNEALKVLSRYSLIQQSSKKIHIHLLMQAVIRLTFQSLSVSDTESFVVLELTGESVVEIHENSRFSWMLSKILGKCAKKKFDPRDVWLFHFMKLFRMCLKDILKNKEVSLFTLLPFSLFFVFLFLNSW